MGIIKSNAQFSSIIDIGIRLNKRAKETNSEILTTHRGVNAVTHINLDRIIPKINFNSPEIQNYPPTVGNSPLREAINAEYFNNKSQADNIFITPGSTLSLDLTFSVLDVTDIFLPEFYWGAYVNILKINNKSFSTYSNFNFLKKNAAEFKNSAVVICEPNNPLGNAENDETIIHTIKELNKNGVIVILDSPYRRIFDKNNNFYKELLGFENVILLESFSKFLGLSGQRIGFLHSNNKEFNKEFKIQLLYATNGTNAFAQKLVYELLTSNEGKKAVDVFLDTTNAGIKENIKFLEEKSFLATEFYSEKKPLGIFVIVNKSQEELFAHNIGSVNLSFFNKDKEKYKNYSRICVSVKPKKLREFFEKL